MVVRSSRFAWSKSTPHTLATSASPPSKCGGGGGAARLMVRAGSGSYSRRRPARRDLRRPAPPGVAGNWSRTISLHARTLPTLRLASWLDYGSRLASYRVRLHPTDKRLVLQTRGSVLQGPHVRGHECRRGIFFPINREFHSSMCLHQSLVLASLFALEKEKKLFSTLTS